MSLDPFGLGLLITAAVTGTSEALLEARAGHRRELVRQLLAARAETQALHDWAVAELERLRNECNEPDEPGIL